MQRAQNTQWTDMCSYKTCACETTYVLCVCENFFEMSDKGNEVCNLCHKQMPVRGLDLTV